MKMILFLAVAIATLNAQAKTWKVKTANSNRTETVFSLDNGTVFENDKISCSVIDAKSSDDNTERKIMTCTGNEVSVTKVSLCVLKDDDTSYFFNALSKTQPLVMSFADRTIQIFLYCED